LVINQLSLRLISYRSVFIYVHLYAYVQTKVSILYYKYIYKKTKAFTTTDLLHN